MIKRKTDEKKSESITASRNPVTPRSRHEINTILSTNKTSVVKIPSKEKSFTRPLALTNCEHIERNDDVHTYVNKRRL